MDDQIICGHNFNKQYYPRLVEKIGTRVIDKPIRNQLSFYDNKWENVIFLVKL